MALNQEPQNKIADEMMLLTTDKIERYKREADQLLDIARPTTAAVLRIVAHLSFQEAVLLCSRNLSPDVITRVAALTGLPSAVVEDVTSRIIQQDLSEFGAEHERLSLQFKEKGSPTREVERFLADLCSGQVVFVFHGGLVSWNERGGFLNDFIIEDDGSESFYEIVAGYLISQGMGFATSVDVLRHSYIKQWPKWREFWTWF